MKKLISLLIITLLCVAGCSSDDENVKTPTEQKKKEYTMAEFSDMLEPLYDKIREQSEFLTEDEIDMLGDLFYKTAKEMGLPVGERIVLRGKVHDVWSENETITVSISSQTKDDDYKISTDFPVWCEVKKCPEAVFLNENDVIAIEGIFLQENDIEYLMCDCEIKSPTIKIDEYKNNMKTISDEAYNSYSEYLDELLYFETNVEMYGVVQGEYDMTPKGFKDGYKTLFGTNEKWSKYIENNNYVYTITTEDGSYGAWIFCDKDLFDLEQKVYISSSLEATIMDVDGEHTVFVLGDVSFADAYYIYK